jgi:hypothetical protein
MSKLFNNISFDHFIYGRGKINCKGLRRDWAYLNIEAVLTPIGRVGKFLVYVKSSQRRNFSKSYQHPQMNEDGQDNGYDLKFPLPSMRRTDQATMAYMPDV